MIYAVKPLAQDCPFCGKGARTWEDDLGFRGASCSDAECSASELIMTIEQWDRRTPPAGWKPIETAPKDATRILAYGGDKHQPLKVEVVHWHYGAWVPDGYTHGVIFKDHTHWMPLPAAPENDDER